MRISDWSSDVCSSDLHALAVPEAVEGLRSLAGDGTEAEGIEVAKAELRRQAEVFVADVAAAEDDGTVVGDQQLVVHALVDAVEMLDGLEDLPHQRALAPGIEDTQFDVRMRSDRGGGGVAKPLLRGPDEDVGGEIVDEIGRAHV